MPVLHRPGVSNLYYRKSRFAPSSPKSNLSGAANHI
uniref:Uncharacterized protein n=1 Tax=Lepeophtheirus salmonis TaxID=72036 RepID=A0A0K2V8P9_LEPSM